MSVSPVKEEQGQPTSVSQSPYIMYSPGRTQGALYAFAASNPNPLSIIRPQPQMVLASVPSSGVYPPHIVPITGMGQESVFLPPYGLLAPGLNSHQALQNHQPQVQGTPPICYIQVQPNAKSFALPTMVPQLSPLAATTTPEEVGSPLDTPKQASGTAILSTQQASCGSVQQSARGVVFRTPSSRQVIQNDTEDTDQADERTKDTHLEHYPSQVLHTASSVPATKGDSHVSSGTTMVLSQVISRRGRRRYGGLKNDSSLEKLLTSSEEKAQHESIFVQLQDEPHFVSFYRFFKASKLSKYLKVRTLTTEGTTVLRWIEITRIASHIDPEMGPIDAARILISSHGLCKVQLLFPYFKTVYTKFMPTNQEEANALLGELSLQHVLCPGLPDYQDKYMVLGYHPAHVRVLETPYLRRYDHDKCPLWHVPSNMFSKSSHIVHNMCKQCRGLQNNLVRLAMKACEVDPAEKSRWTASHTNQRLSYSDKDEQHQKSKQKSQLLNHLKTYGERLQVGGTSQKRTSIERESIGGSETWLHQKASESSSVSSIESTSPNETTNPVVTATLQGIPTITTTTRIPPHLGYLKVKSEEVEYAQLPTDQIRKRKRERESSGEETESGSEGEEESQLAKLITSKRRKY